MFDDLWTGTERARVLELDAELRALLDPAELDSCARSFDGDRLSDLAVGVRADSVQPGKGGHRPRRQPRRHGGASADH